MLKAYKTEIFPTYEQGNKIIQSIGICRFLYNQYLNFNFKKYKEAKTTLVVLAFTNTLTMNYPKNIH
jgi:putative transposase